MKYVDLSRILDSNITVYPGDPIPAFKTLAEVGRDAFTVTEVCSIMHAGTHIDAPLHFVENGIKVSDIEVEKFFCRGVLIDVRELMEIGTSMLLDFKIDKNDCVLFYSGWDKYYGERNYFTNYPSLTENLADELINKKVTMIGVDMPSVDYDPFMVHKKLLGNNVYILENLINLNSLSEVGEFNIIALPAKYSTEAAPCRVIAYY